MSEELYYDDVNYADSRMRGTIMSSVRNEPLYIAEVSYHSNRDGIWAFATNLANDVEGWIDIRDILFQPIQLGYMNLGSGCYYFKRRALRQDWRQGIRNGNFESDYPGNIRMLGRALYDLMNNKYPSLEDCVFDVMTTNITSKAFNKHFALEFSLVNNKMKLKYKGDHIGYITSNLTFTLDRKYIYLQERLEDAINEHN